ncbi:MAG: GNAT family protein [Syntrophomonadaceae bacterium]|nr:GNAT family protein [Syntrophomonadaceae bacterium]MDD3023558.1 GNAT family protein [Syntrophomonadaceae bacterium]
MIGARKIIGNRVHLCPLDISDSPIYLKWLNDIDTYIYLDASSLLINSEIGNNLFQNPPINGEQMFSIRLNSDDTLIGNCGLIKIDNINRKAELGRVFIGEKDYRNQGYGTEGIMLLLDYGFNILNLNSISVLCCSYNNRAAKSYAKCGFKTAGCFRQAKIINGEKYDENILDILAEEFLGSPYKARLNGFLA